MATTKMVAKVIHNGTYKVVFDVSKKHKPFTIYYEWYDNGKHRKKIAEYENIVGCMYHLTEEVIKR